MAFTLPAMPSAKLRRWLPRLPRFSLTSLRTAAKTAAAMPLGTQQLRRQRTSTLLSLAGVTASLLVIFAQLGIERAVYESSVRLHRMVAGDLVIVPYGFKSMQLHGEVPVAVTDIIATTPSVQSYSPFWFGVMSISHAGMDTSRRLAWYAVDPERPAVDVPGLKENLHKLRETRRILVRGGRDGGGQGRVEHADRQGVGRLFRGVRHERRGLTASAGVSAAADGPRLRGNLSHQVSAANQGRGPVLHELQRLRPSRSGL